MSTPESILPVLKSLADDTRLRVVGLLASRPYTVEELATVLELRASTVSHHLSKLSRSGVVRSTTRGHYHVYSLEWSALEGLAQRLQSPREVRALARVGDAVDPYDDKVLSVFLDDEGRVKALPMKRKKFQVLLRHALQLFTDEGPWDEREVNRRLEVLSKDTASFRRGFIDHGYMERTASGDRYWRVES